MKTIRRKILFLSVALSAFVLSVFLTYLVYFGWKIEQLATVPEIQTEDPAKVDFPTDAPDQISLNQDVRSLDFKNFTYEWFPKNDTIFKKRIILRNGENEKVHLEGKRHGPLGEDYQEQLRNISYADLTGDGKEEAIVTVGVALYRWYPMCIFVFSEKNKKAVQIWKYETDVHDSDLSLRGLRIEEGKLVVEEFEDGMSYRRAKNVLRKTFSWNGKTLELKSLETFPWNNENKDFTCFPSEKY